MEIDFKKYSELFLKHQKEYKDAEEKYLIDNNMVDEFYKKGINSINHPKYFEPRKNWDKLRAELDAPILAKAKYKVGDKLDFWLNQFTGTTRHNGICIDFKTSGTGSGEILYCFGEIFPKVPYCNPSTLEKDIIGLLK